MAKTKGSNYIIQSVTLACSLLEQFQLTEAELSLTALARSLGINKNMAYRLLATLERHSFVSRAPSSTTYRLGTANLRLAVAYARSKDLLTEARPFLAYLAERSNETVILAVLANNGLVCEEVVESTLPVRVVTSVGTRLSPSRTSAGRVVLAYGEEAVRSALLEQEEERSVKRSKAGCHPDDFRLIRQRGYAVTSDESGREVSAVAAPIRNHDGTVIGAVSVVGPSFRFTLTRLYDEIAPLVLMSAGEISLRMGFRGAAGIGGTSPVTDGQFGDADTSENGELADAITEGKLSEFLVPSSQCKQGDVSDTLRWWGRGCNQYQ